MNDVPTFSERLARRQRLWWDRPHIGGERTIRDALHRLRERRAFRDRDDRDEQWRCCNRWPRTLMNKWNGREFAARHGCPLPELYWRGSDPRVAPLESLPDRFVIRPVFGAARRGAMVVVDGEERLWGGAVSSDDVRERLPRSRLGGKQVLIEEFVEPDDPAERHPLELKVHVFGGHAAAILVIHRRGPGDVRFGYYSPDWTRIDDPINTFAPSDERREPPESLARMLELATTMGMEMATFMRVDFFAGAREPVFNEFSSLPIARHYTPFADRWLGELWSRYVPDAS